MNEVIEDSKEPNQNSITVKGKTFSLEEKEV